MSELLSIQYVYSREMTNNKKCGRCKKIKNSESFHKNSRSKDGLQSRCKMCRSITKKSKKVARTEQIKKIAPNSQDLENLKEFDMQSEVVRNKKVHHFSALYIAQSRSGKSTNLLYQIKKIRKNYDIIIMVSDSVHAAIYRNFKFDLLTNGHNNKCVKIIRFLRKFQKHTNNKFNVLLILDDFAKRSCKYIRDLFTNARNSNISIIQSVQDNTMVSNHSRYNTLYVFLFNNKNSQAIDRTYTFWLKSFIKPPSNLKTEYEKREWTINYFLKNTRNYQAMVLNIDKGLVMRSKAPKLD